MNFKNHGHAYVSECISDDKEEEEEVQDEEEEAFDDEDIARISIKGRKSFPPPPMCLMAKGGIKNKKILGKGM